MATMAGNSRRAPYSIPFDTTIFVSASIDEVYKTLFEAGVLVLVVIMLFLQNFRATLVPATTVPVTIIGAFAAMAALGFSINMLPCSRSFWPSASSSMTPSWWSRACRITSNEASRRRGPIDAMGELTSPILGITLVLMSVFIPAASCRGSPGRCTGNSRS